MKLAMARRIGMEVVEALSPACERIVVAGSIRREKAQPGDVEIVYLPRLVEIQKDLFTREWVPATEQAVVELVLGHFWRFDQDTQRNGPLYKRMIKEVATAGVIGGWPREQVVIELYRALPDNWGLQLALRTGPADFNHLLVTQRQDGGAMPRGMRMAGASLWRGEERLASRTEEEFFEQIGVPCWRPEERTQARLAVWMVQACGRQD